jgi:hypothetical protein
MEVTNRYLVSVEFFFIVYLNIVLLEISRVSVLFVANTTDNLSILLDMLHIFAFMLLVH